MISKFNLALAVALMFAPSLLAAQAPVSPNLVSPNHYGLVQPLNPGEILVSPPWPPIQISEIAPTITPLTIGSPIQGVPVFPTTTFEQPAIENNSVGEFDQTAPAPPIPAPKFQSRTVLSIPGQMIQTTSSSPALKIDSQPSEPVQQDKLAARVPVLEGNEHGQPLGLSAADEALVTELRKSLNRNLSKKIDELNQEYDAEIQQLLDQGKTKLHPKVVQLKMIRDEKIARAKHKAHRKLHHSIKLLSN